jgi:hypothetical protein
MKVIDSNIEKRDALGKPLHTFPHPAQDERTGTVRRFPIRQQFQEFALNPGERRAHTSVVSF